MAKFHVKTYFGAIARTCYTCILIHVIKVLFVCFVALGPKSTAMVMAGRSVHLTHFFLGKLEQVVNQYFVHILLLITDDNLS